MPMTEPRTSRQHEKTRRVLDPIERISEVLFGLIMALTFTGSIRVSSAGQSEIRTLLIGAIGCNLAWGIVDAVIYLVTTLIERSRRITTLQNVRNAASSEQARAVIAEAMPPDIASIVTSQELEVVRVRLVQLPDPPARPHLTRSDLAAAGAVFLLVVLSTFPVVLPFAIVGDVRLAMNVSNAVALLMLFTCGCSLGRYAGRRTLFMGLSMVATGAALVGTTLLLGG